MDRVQIDLNVRTPEGWSRTAVGPNDARHLRVGDHVIAFEPEDAVEADAVVCRIAGRFVYLDVDWSSLRDCPVPLEVDPWSQGRWRSAAALSVAASTLLWAGGLPQTPAVRTGANTPTMASAALTPSNQA